MSRHQGCDMGRDGYGGIRNITGGEEGMAASGM